MSEFLRLGGPILDGPVDLGSVVVHPVDFGQLTYEPGAPKNAPRWVWKCDCDECSQRPLLDVLHGPFKTLRAAEKDAEQVIMLMASEPQGTS
jgi:hypothetical protein